MENKNKYSYKTWFRFWHINTNLHLTVQQIYYCHFLITTEKNTMKVFYKTYELHRMKKPCKTTDISVSLVYCSIGLAMIIPVEMDLKRFLRVTRIYNDDAIKIIQISPILIGVCCRSCYQNLLNLANPSWKTVIAFSHDLTMMASSEPFKLPWTE